MIHVYICKSLPRESFHQFHLIGKNFIMLIFNILNYHYFKCIVYMRERGMKERERETEREIQKEQEKERERGREGGRETVLR